MPVCSALRLKIASTAPAAPSRWPMADLVEEMLTFLTAFAE